MLSSTHSQSRPNFVLESLTISSMFCLSLQMYFIYLFLFRIYCSPETSSGGIVQRKLTNKYKKIYKKIEVVNTWFNSRAHYSNNSKLKIMQHSEAHVTYIHKGCDIDSRHSSNLGVMKKEIHSFHIQGYPFPRGLQMVKRSVH